MVAARRHCSAEPSRASQAYLGYALHSRIAAPIPLRHHTARIAAGGLLASVLQPLAKRSVLSTGMIRHRRENEKSTTTITMGSYATQAPAGANLGSTQKASGATKKKESNLSRMPPWPGKRCPKSLTSASRFSIDAVRSPTNAMVATPAPYTNPNQGLGHLKKNAPT